MQKSNVPKTINIGYREFNRRNHFKKYRSLYLMVIPGILYFIIFQYIPIAGNVIAFKKYDIFKGIWGSEFVGLYNFKILFQYKDFVRILVNTMVINLLDLMLQFPAPIILALMINEVINRKYKRIVQSVVYLPHFLSWIVIGGIISTQFLSLSTGMINHLLEYMGRESVYFLIEPKYARGIVIVSGLFRDTGWGSILYLATITNISPELYHAAQIDGAGRIRQIWSITIPSLIPIMVIIFLLKIGNFFDYGFSRIYVFMNGVNMSKIDIFDTYVYRVGIQQMRYSYATAVGLFKSAAGMILLGGANWLSKRYTEESIL